MKHAVLIAIAALTLAIGVPGYSLAHPSNSPAAEGGHVMDQHHSGKPKARVTPYGDFCPRCNSYGARTKQVTHEGALKAIKDYFHAMGLEVRNLRGRGRFLKADIYKDGRLVDRIVFDRKTGRIRSIF